MDDCSVIIPHAKSASKEAQQTLFPSCTMIGKLYSLPLSVSSSIFGSWLVLKDIVVLDSAFCNNSMRSHFVSLLRTKELIHHNTVFLRGTNMLRWLSLKSLKIASVLFNAQTVLSPILLRYFRSFGDSVRCVHFRDEGRETDMMFLVACYCTNIVVFCCTDVSIPWQFHAILLNNPNIQEMRLHRVTCLLADLMNDLSLHKLQILSIKDTNCPKGFLWSASTYSDSLQIADFSTVHTYDTDVNAFTRNCKNLRSFGMQSGMSDCVLRTVLSNRPEMVNLCISYNGRITDDGVQFIAQNLPFLRTLNIQNCSTLTTRSLSHIAEYCNKLEVLYTDIKGASEATERIVETFSQKCTKVTYLNINSDFVLCSTTCSLSLIQGCPAMHTLVINEYKNITPTTRGFCALIRPELKILVHDEGTEYNILTMPI